MDPLAHTLTGAALGEAGLKRRTGLGMATLVIAANLPDIDVLGLLVGENLAWRRGWTHGPVAWAVLPPLLAGAMLALDRWQARRGARPPDRAPVRFGWLLALATIGVLSHPLLDFLNTYGIRCLMPFSDRWFYGDALFIIDLGVWAALGAGIWLARRRGRRGSPSPGRPALVALCLVTAYSLAMGAASGVAERMVARDVVARGLGVPDKVVASPVPIDPFRRDMVFEVGGAYGFGEVRFLPRLSLALDPALVPTNMAHPAIPLAARQDEKVADFLYWSRLPFAELRRLPGATEVTIGDARYDRLPVGGRFTVRTVVPDRAPAPATAPPRPPPASAPE
jgi:inner membrane protein